MLAIQAESANRSTTSSARQAETFWSIACGWSKNLPIPIDKHQKGTYWLAYFEIDGPSIPKIDRALQLCEPVLRHMTIKLEPRLIEPILANARGESVQVSTPHDTVTDDT